MTDIHNRTEREKRIQEKIRSNPEISEHNKNQIQKLVDKVKAEGGSKDRIHNYLWSLHKICANTDFQLGKADQDDLIKVVGKINSNDLTDKDYSPYSKAEFRKTLSKYYRSIQDNEEIVDFMQIDPKKKEIKKLDAEELPRPEYIKELLDVCRNIRDEALIMTLWDTGARIEAVLNLKWKNFQPGEDQAYIEFTERNKTMLRKIPIASSQPILKQWMNQHPEPEAESYIFTKYEGNLSTREPGKTPMKYPTAYSMIKRRRKDADLPDKVEKNLTPHSFRKARATFLASTGMNVNMLAKYMGWSQISTAQKYVSLAQDQLDSAFREAVGLEQKNGEGLDWDNEELQPGKCRSCQEIVSKNWNKCPSCGTSINPEKLLAVLENDEEKEPVTDTKLERLEKEINKLKEQRS